MGKFSKKHDDFAREVMEMFDKYSTEELIEHFKWNFELEEGLDEDELAESMSEIRTEIYQDLNMNYLLFELCDALDELIEKYGKK